QNSNIFGVDDTGVYMPGTYALYKQGMYWSDYRVSLQMKSDDDDGIGIMFRYRDNDNYYRFSWDSQRRYRQLVKKDSGVFTLLAWDDVPYVTGRTYQVEIVASGAILEVFIDGVLVLWARDSSLQSGSIALYSWGNVGSHFEDVVVTRIVPSGLWDGFGDGNLSDWNVVDEGSGLTPSNWAIENGVLVQSTNIFGGDRVAIDMPGTYALCRRGGLWTDYTVSLSMTSGDNDGIGIMFRYRDNENYYRFSWDSQRCYRRLMKKENGIFSLLAEDSVPYVVGRRYNVRIRACGPLLRVFIDGEPVLSASDFSLKSGTVALYSWANTGSYFDDIVVEQISSLDLTNANDGDCDAWSVVDEGSTDGPSSWSAIDNRLVQSSNIFGGDGKSIDMPGTYVLYRYGIWLTDYRVSLQMRSDDDDGIGIMVRCRDNDNYYRFSWDSQRQYRQLVKKQCGVFSLLAWDPAPYISGRTYQVQIVALGPTLKVFIDDDLIFWVTDFGLDSGSIALYTWGNAGSHFSDVVVRRF
ncbi:MAG: hypothetical protein JSU94_00645, partial [Phycisphaerales bacterium]